MLKELALKIRKYLSEDKIMRGFQHDILYASADDLDKGHTGGIICGPTGIGKTIIMGSEAKALGFDSLILVPKKIIANNTRDEFRDILKIPEDDIGVYHADIPKADKEKALGRKIFITTPQSFRKLVTEGSLDASRFGYTAIDEGHKFRGRYTRHVLQKHILDRDDVVIRTYTATDKFMDGTTVGQVLFERDDYISYIPLDTAIRKAFLSGVRSITVRSKVKYEGKNHTGELSDKELSKLASRLGRDEMAISFFAQYVDPLTNTALRDKPSVWYCVDTTHARAKVKELNDIFGPGYARFISGKSRDQDKIQREHKEGKFQALVNADLLIEGWNNQACVTCVMLRDSVSPIVVAQAGGRVLRLDPNDPFKLAYVISIVDEGRPFSLTFADILGSNFVMPEGFSYDDKPVVAPSKLNLQKKLPQLEDIEAIITEQEHLLFMQEREKEKTLYFTPSKTTGWLTSYQTATSFGTSHDGENFQKFWKTAIDGQHTFTPPLRFQLMQTITGRSYYYLHQDELPRVRKFLGLKDFDIQGERPDDWLHKVGVSKALGLKYEGKIFQDFWSKVESGTLDIQPPLQTGYFKTRSLISLCIHKSEMPRILTYLGLDRNQAEGTKTNEWLGKVQFAKKLQIDFTNTKFKKFWTEAENGKFIDPANGKFLKTVGKRACFCVHESEVETAIKYLDLKITDVAGPKTAEWLSRIDLSKQLKVKPEHKAMNEFLNKAEKGELVFDPPLKSGYFMITSNKPFCIHISEVKRVEEYIEKAKGINIIGVKTDEWLTGSAMAVKIGMTTSSPLIRDFWKKLMNNELTFDPPLKAGYLKSKSSDPFCVHISEAQRVNDYLRNKAPETALTDTSQEKLKTPQILARRAV